MTLYLIGATSLLVLIAISLYQHKVYGSLSQVGARIVCAGSLIGLLYVLDFCTSTADDFDFTYRYWVFFPLCAFLGIGLLLDAKFGRQMLEVLTLALGLQCACAVFAYFLGINQFMTPYFGSRTCGTFDSPNTLYPLCLFTVGLGAGLACAAADRFSRCLFAIVALLGAVAILLTFTRSAWLALAVMGVYFGFNAPDLLPPSSRLTTERIRRVVRLLIVSAAVALVSATGLVRTKGRPIGNSDDRSFWGRVAIWRTAWGIFRERPLTGYGFATYSKVQYRPRYLTSDLQRYNPMNIEPKNFWLNLACEFGLVGLAVWGWLMLAYVRLYRVGRQSLRTGTPERAVFIGIHASLFGLVVAGLFDTPILAQGREAATLVTFVCLGVMYHLIPAPSASPLAPAILRRWKRVGAGALLVVGVILLYLACVTARTVLPLLPEIEPLQTRNPSLPHFAPLHQIAQPLRDATLAMEDYRFYLHNGIDGEALHRALRKNVRALRIKEGGSTITMQLAKNLFLTRQRTLTRKLSEMALARSMEKRLSKDRILELYLNVIDYGLGARGIGEAAPVYFGKPPSELTLAESALLAGLVPRPPKGSLDAVYAEKARREALRRISRVFTNYTPEELERANQERLPTSIVMGNVEK
jgi:O-antigen ligase